MTTKNCYILFETKESTAKSLEANQSIFKGNHLRVDRSSKKKPQTKNTAFIGNLHYETTDEQLREFFSGLKITNIRIIRDKYERLGKGFGYVSFETVQDFYAALKKSGESLKERNLRILKAVSAENVERVNQTRKNAMRRLKIP